MELNEILNDMQSSLDDFQKKLNELRAVRTGSLYEVDVLMTRKEAAYFIGRSTRQLDRLCSEHKIRREFGYHIYLGFSDVAHILGSSPVMSLA